jgi:vacuolar-type H+-ATPase subunit H
MSESSQTDEAIQRVKDAFDRAVDEAEEVSETAQDEFQEAVDELEEQIGRIRNRD